ncbi:hypothetical protein [Pseudogemmobacter blasticus]|uniref:Uncharacterized protein n=1 Tax=Fuscovulum blasticum DSM 2131 TaxID=1188250 RepID=A0A2T4JDA8_FUSBL|nr:hypothetical protein [Fuscovulum blasticum]PTE15904.1 hypothetical protein C5F44_02375 [Fuscovulum blasticum DSM 2131]
MSVTYDFAVRAGNSGTTKNEVGLVLTHKARSADGAVQPVDLTGADVVFTARLVLRKPSVLRKSSGAGEISLTPAEGRILIPFSAADTRALWGEATGPEVILSYEVEVRRTDPPSQRTIMQGRLKVLPGGNDD